MPVSKENAKFDYHLKKIEFIIAHHENFEM